MWETGRIGLGRLQPGETHDLMTQARGAGVATGAATETTSY
jgi:hypothetical protein